MLRGTLSIGLVFFLTVSGGCRYLEVVEADAEVSDSIRTKYDDAFGWVDGYDDAAVEEIALRAGARRVLSIDSKGEKKEADDSAPPPPALETVFTFVQISDVQLRDERVKLGGPLLTKLIDLIVPTNIYGEEQERYDSAVYLSLVKTLNQYNKELRKSKPVKGSDLPLFVAHTGDAIHAGVLQELYEFLWISAKLDLPWVQLIGNHDVTAFGTELLDVQVHEPRLGYFPLYDDVLFMHMHGDNAKSTRSVFRPGIYIAPPQGSPHRWTADMLDTRNHGFDRNGDKGYYSIRQYLDELPRDFDESNIDDVPKEWWELRNPSGFKVRFIFLHTSAASELHWGSFGEDDEQVLWLREELLEARKNKESVVAFGHHDFPGGFNPSDENAQKVAGMFAKQPGFLGYFCGHTHKQEMRVVKVEGKNGSKTPLGSFWQVIAPSILEWPQSGLIVRLVGDPEKQLAWDITPFTHGFHKKHREKLDPDDPDATRRLRAQALLASESAKDDFSGDPEEEMKRPPVRLLIPFSSP